ncbi:7-carboxy-7-deazaguanine synthase QueE [bacterium]|nr:7-carboxy-7-deazaguanine synthase QueE [bacterium]
MTKIKEIFTSIQGEGPYVGYKQLFIRFCGCNLNCKYCDTNFDINGAKEYTKKELLDICNSVSDCHSVALTGGEPLLNTDFLKDFLPDCPLDIYLETNGTLFEELNEIIDFVDYISMDIKLPSCSEQSPQWEAHDKFLKNSKEKNIFVKVVFDNNINDYEIVKTTRLVSKYGCELILQPKMDGKSSAVSAEFMTNVLDKFLKHYKNTRLIPQVHKFLNVD